MSKKTLLISLIVLGLGSGLIPTGFIIDRYVDNMVGDSVDDGLLGIQEGALPMVESMIAELGIPRTLRDIREVGLKELEAIVNATFFMFLINMTLHEPTTLGVVPISLFFDRWIQWVLIIPVTFSSALQNMGYPPIKGISEYFQQDLWYGEAKYFLMEGNGTLPGLIGNNTMGTGVIDYLDLYDTALGNSTLEQELASGYNTTWTKLSKLTQYYREYFVPIAIPMLVDNLETIMPEYSGMNTKEIAEMYFYEQWANCTLYSEGIDFSAIVDELDEPLYGFEVGRNIPSNITREAINELWNEQNIRSILNDTGINEWILAQENQTLAEDLCIEFGLEPYQMALLLNWLWKESFKWNIVPVLITLPHPIGEGMSLSEYAKVIFLEVWVNGTADGKVLYLYGFPLELKVITVYGFEIGYQSQKVPVIPTNISLKSARLLWNVSNDFSLVNKNGLKEWFEAVEDPDSATTYGLMMANHLEKDQVAMILKWLPQFKDKVMPFLVQEEMNLPADSKSLTNNIMLGMNLSGAGLIGLAGILLTISIVKKKRLT
jgi:hypothetical protein